MVRYQQAINILIDQMESAGEVEIRDLQKRMSMYLEEADYVKEIMKQNPCPDVGDEKSQDPPRSPENEGMADVEMANLDDNPIYDAFSSIGGAVMAVGRGVGFVMWNEELIDLMDLMDLMD